MTLTSPSNRVLTTVTDASGHYAFENLQGDFVMNICHLKVDAGGGNARVAGVQVGPNPSTKEADLSLGTSPGLTLVDGQALAPTGAPAGGGLLQPHIEIKVFKGDTQTAVPLLAPGGAGTYGQYRIGFTAPAGSYRVVLYEGSIAVDSDYVSAATGSHAAGRHAARPQGHREPGGHDPLAGALGPPDARRCAQRRRPVGRDTSVGPHGQVGPRHERHRE